MAYQAGAVPQCNDALNNVVVESAEFRQRV